MPYSWVGVRQGIPYEKVRLVEKFELTPLRRSIWRWLKLYLTLKDTKRQYHFYLKFECNLKDTLTTKSSGVSYLTP